MRMEGLLAGLPGTRSPAGEGPCCADRAEGLVGTDSSAAAGLLGSTRAGHSAAAARLAQGKEGSLAAAAPAGGEAAVGLPGCSSATGAWVGLPGSAPEETTPAGLLGT